MKNGISIIGGGAIGFALAATLQSEGRNVVVYRVTSPDSGLSLQKVSVRLADGSILDQNIATESLSATTELDGIVLVTAKAMGNSQIAELIKPSCVSVDVILLQNGLGVESPFLGKHFRSISRCVVYITAERLESGEYTARMVKPSPIGLIEKNGIVKSDICEFISSRNFQFYEEKDIPKEVWKKGIINTVFNSVCPLLEVDNGIFVRDSDAYFLAQEIVSECVPVANSIGITLTIQEILDQIMSISERSAGQLISTLQDIRAKRETEILYFNKAICDIASTLTPPKVLPKTELVGFLVNKKSEIGRTKT